MCGRKSEFERAGVQVVFVGPGRPEHARVFAADRGCGLPILCDPGQAIQRAAELRSGLRALLHPRLLANALRAWRAGHRQTQVQGNPWQLGGALVFDRDGALRLAHADRAAGDPLDVDRLLAAAQEVIAGDAAPRVPR